MTDLVEKARIFATAAHGATGQLRKYTGEPYIVHPGAVAHLVTLVPHDDAMLAAAWLHDVVEDTLIPTETIATEFGPDVAELVTALTDVSDPLKNRATRKRETNERLTLASGRAQTIKVADLIDNSRTILTRDPKFAPIYLAEKVETLAILVKADPALRMIATQQIEEACA